MTTAIHRKVEAASRGEYPFAIAELDSGWICLAETQPLTNAAGAPLHGYCVLFSNPVVADLNALSLERRAQWGLDCARVGDALIKVLGAVRVNYETWGNLDPALHTHITPRFQAESPEKRVQTPRGAYDWNAGVSLDINSPGVRELIEKLRAELMTS